MMRALGVASKALFFFQFAIMFALRHFAPFSWSDLLAMALSVALCASLYTWGTSRALRAIIATLVATAVVMNALSYFYFHQWIDAQLFASALHNWADVRPVAKAMALRVSTLFLAVFAIEYALLAFSRVVISTRVRFVMIAIFVIALVIPSARAETPELALVHALVSSRVNAPSNATSTTSLDVDVPVLSSRSAHPPNVLFVLLESVREASYCKDVNAPCAVAPKTRELFASGVSLTQARSVASYTAVSFDAIVTGQTQQGSKESLQKMPTLFEYLHHASIANHSISVAYFSSQSESVFERASARAAIDVSCTVESLVGHEVADEDDVINLGVDRLLEKRVAQELPKLRAPYFAFVHVSGTHAPYFVDDSRAPKKPYVRYASWSKLDELRNAYDDAIFTQDESVAAMIRTFIDTQRGAPYVIILTSDHGEAFGEHAAIHHGQNLYDEQIHVPLFVTFSSNALSEAKTRALRENAHAFSTHLDLLPTILDAFDLDASSLAITGKSLFSAIPSDRAAIPITDCTAMFPCPVSTWGMLGAGRSLIAQPWDGAFHCMDLASGGESVASDPACVSLALHSREFFPKLPNGEPNR